MLITIIHMIMHDPQGNLLLTNQALADITGIPYGKIRRHVKETLPPDLRATIQSGYAREYSLRDAYYIYLVVHMVAGLKVTAPEAKIIIDSVRDWLTEKNLFPGEDEIHWERTLDEGYEILIQREGSDSGFCCVAVKRLKKELIEAPATYREEYTQERISGNCDGADELNLRFLKVSELKRNFLTGFDRYLHEGGTKRKRLMRKKFKIRRK
jgi:hypothetical protein